MQPRYEELEHTADLALNIYGRDLEELFINAAHALKEEMYGPEEVKAQVQREVELEAPSPEELLVGWLNELIYLYETEGEIYSQFRLEFPASGRLVAKLGGDKVDRVRLLIKAATFYDLEIQRDEKGLKATVVFDV